MKRAEKIDAVKKEKFYFRQFLSPPDMTDPCIAEIYKNIPAPNYEDCDPDAVGVCIIMISRVADCCPCSRGCVACLRRMASRRCRWTRS